MDELTIRSSIMTKVVSKLLNYYIKKTKGVNLDLRLGSVSLKAEGDRTNIALNMSVSTAGIRDFTEKL